MSDVLRVVDLQQGSLVISNECGFRTDAISSLDGQLLAFSSLDSANHVWNHFLYEMGNTNLIALPLPNDATMTGISSDGQKIAFASCANAEPANQFHCQQVYIYERASNTIVLISQAVSPATSSAIWDAVQTTSQCLSADGRWLAFSSADARLATNDFNGKSDVFLYDTWSGLRQLISRSFDGSESADGASREPVLSAAGQYRVQYKDTLTDTAWIDLPSGISLIGARGFCFDTVALPLKQRFYRVVVDP